MKNHDGRLTRLEAAAAPQVRRYVCYCYAGPAGFDVLGFDGNLRHFATMAELAAFAARPGVELIRVGMDLART